MGLQMTDALPLCLTEIGFYKTVQQKRCAIILLKLDHNFFLGCNSAANRKGINVLFFIFV